MLKTTLLGKLCVQMPLPIKIVPADEAFYVRFLFSLFHLGSTNRLPAHDAPIPESSKQFLCSTPQKYGHHMAKPMVFIILYRRLALWGSAFMINAFSQPLSLHNNIKVEERNN